MVFLPLTFYLSPFFPSRTPAGVRPPRSPCECSSGIGNGDIADWAGPPSSR